MRKGIVYALVALGCFLVIANIIASQQLPALFYSFIDGGRDAVASYLSHIKTLPLFQKEMVRYKNEFGVSLEEDVFREDVQRKKEIRAIEAELKKQPKSPDLLYSLALLYKEDRNNEMAALYLEKAKELDPTIRN